MFCTKTASFVLECFPTPQTLRYQFFLLREMFLEFNSPNLVSGRELNPKLFAGRKQLNPKLFSGRKQLNPKLFFGQELNPKLLQLSFLRNTLYALNPELLQLSFLRGTLYSLNPILFHLSLSLSLSLSLTLSLTWAGGHTQPKTYICKLNFSLCSVIRLRQISGQCFEIIFICTPEQSINFQWGYLNFIIV
jgi:hypothetical protein